MIKKLQGNFEKIRLYGIEKNIGGCLLEMKMRQKKLFKDFKVYSSTIEKVVYGLHRNKELLTLNSINR